MKIYQACSKFDKYDRIVSFLVCQDFDLDQKRSFYWEKICFTIKEPLPIEINRSRKSQYVPDIGYLMDFQKLILSQRAYDCIYPIIKRDVEIIPLDCDGVPYYMVHILTVLDALDEEKTDGIRIDGILYSLDRPVFFDDVIYGHKAFRVATRPTDVGYFTEEVAEAVRQNNLTGFDDRYVWDSQNPYESAIPPAKPSLEPEIEYAKELPEEMPDDYEHITPQEDAKRLEEACHLIKQYEAFFRYTPHSQKEDIVNLEQTLGVSLPEDLKTILCQYEGINIDGFGIILDMSPDENLLSHTMGLRSGFHNPPKRYVLVGDEDEYYYALDLSRKNGNSCVVVKLDYFDILEGEIPDIEYETYSTFFLEKVKELIKNHTHL